jgi:hypothetical protein
MCSNSAKGYSLRVTFQVAREGLRVKGLIIGSKTLDLDSKFRSELLKAVFGLKGVSCGTGYLIAKVHETSGMIHKDTSSFVLSTCRFFTFRMFQSSGHGACEEIHGDAFARLGCMLANGFLFTGNGGSGGRTGWSSLHFG